MPKREKKPLVVLDTNVIISHIWGSANASKIMHAVLFDRKYIPVLSLELLDELKKTIAKPKVQKKVEPEDIKEFIGNIKTVAEYVEPKRKVNVCSDVDDNMFIECALEAKAEYIITGDKPFLSIGSFEGIKIISPANFVKKFLNAK